MRYALTILLGAMKIVQSQYFPARQPPRAETASDVFGRNYLRSNHLSLSPLRPFPLPLPIVKPHARCRNTSAFTWRANTGLVALSLRQACCKLPVSPRCRCRSYVTCYVRPETKRTKLPTIPGSAPSCLTRSQRCTYAFTHPLVSLRIRHSCFAGRGLIAAIITWLLFVWCSRRLNSRIQEGVQGCLSWKKKKRRRKKEERKKR